MTDLTHIVISMSYSFCLVPCTLLILSTETFANSGWDFRSSLRIRDTWSWYGVTIPTEFLSNFPQISTGHEETNSQIQSTISKTCKRAEKDETVGDFNWCKDGCGTSILTFVSNQGIVNELGSNIIKALKRALCYLDWSYWSYFFSIWWIKTW